MRWSALRSLTVREYRAGIRDSRWVPWWTNLWFPASIKRWKFRQSSPKCSLLWFRFSASSHRLSLQPFLDVSSPIIRFLNWMTLNTRLERSTNLLQNCAVDAKVKNNNGNCWYESDSYTNKQQIIEIGDDSQIAFVVEFSTVPSERRKKSEESAKNPAQDDDHLGDRSTTNMISNWMTNGPASVNRHRQQWKHWHGKHR